MESRLAEIEIKLSYTEQTLEELNRTVYRQSREIDELRKQLHALIEQFRSSIGLLSRAPPRD